jgi:hypothetical protein
VNVHLAEAARDSQSEACMARSAYTARGAHSSTQGRRGQARPDMVTPDQRYQRDQRWHVGSQPRGAATNSQRQAAVSWPQGQCFNCQRYGQMSRDCMAPRRGNRGEYRGRYNNRLRTDVSNRVEIKNVEQEYQENSADFQQDM